MFANKYFGKIPNYDICLEPIPAREPVVQKGFSSLFVDQWHCSIALSSCLEPMTRWRIGGGLKCYLERRHSRPSL